MLKGVRRAGWALAWLLAVLFAAAPGHAADPVVAAVGDIACSTTDPNYHGGTGTTYSCRQQNVSDLLVAASPNALLLLGDNQYDAGSLAEYLAVFNDTVGRLNGVAYPVLGNAEYVTPGASGFFSYFERSDVGVLPRLRASATDASQVASGYYSFEIGSWHMIALNSNCGVVACDAGSPQEQWLRADLAAHPAACTLAFWHHPRWNTGPLGNEPPTAAFWSDLDAAGADVVLNGHGDHHYERFRPQNAQGEPDPANGIREFIVSTGGQSHGAPLPSPPLSATSEVTNYTSYGILRLTLRAGGYDWLFEPESGGFTDSGSASCHGSAATAPPPPPPPPAVGVATELDVTRVVLDPRRRLLEVRGTISRSASAAVQFELRAAGRRKRFRAPIRNAGFRVRKKVTRAEANARSSMLSIRYGGDAQVRGLTERLRAGTRGPGLKLHRPRIVADRLIASGSVSRRARGFVRMQLEYVSGGLLRPLRFRARIRHGRWVLASRLTPQSRAEIAQRTGTLHSYTLYTGDAKRHISGALRSFRVLGSR